MKLRSRITVVLLVALLLTSVAVAGPKDPITGDRYHALITAQQTELQRELEVIFLESEGYHVTGPLDPFF